MVNGLSLLGSAVAVATPRSDCSGGGLLCTLGEQEKKKKFKIFRSAEIRTRDVLDGSEKVVSMVIETVSQIIV